MKEIRSNQVQMTFNNTPQGIKEFAEVWESKYPAHLLSGMYMFGSGEVTAILSDETERSN